MHHTHCFVCLATSQPNLIVGLTTQMAPTAARLTTMWTVHWLHQRASIDIPLSTYIINQSSILPVNTTRMVVHEVGRVPLFLTKNSKLVPNMATYMKYLS